MAEPGQSNLPRVNITINDCSSEFIMDTGPTVTIIDQETYTLIGSPPLKESTMRIYAYKANEPVKLSGEFWQTLSVGLSKRRIRETVYVTAEGRQDSILSCKAALGLHLIKLDKSVQQSINNIGNNTTKPIGKIKGVNIKLHIDMDIKPVAPPHRRIPYHLRDKVEEEIQRLEDIDVIERVTGPTPWVSPVVIVPKPNGSIRLCVDMRQPNRAIQRERHIIPTLEDILAEVNGSKIFSVIDLNQAYHQVPNRHKYIPETSVG